MAEKQEFTRKLKSRHIQLMALGEQLGRDYFSDRGRQFTLLVQQSF